MDDQHTSFSVNGRNVVVNVKISVHIPEPSQANQEYRKSALPLNQLKAANGIGDETFQDNKHLPDQFFVNPFRRSNSQVALNPRLRTTQSVLENQAIADPFGWHAQTCQSIGNNSYYQGKGASKRGSPGTNTVFELSNMPNPFSNKVNPKDVNASPMTPSSHQERFIRDHSVDSIREIMNVPADFLANDHGTSTAESRNASPFKNDHGTPEKQLFTLVPIHTSTSGLHQHILATPVAQSSCPNKSNTPLVLQFNRNSAGKIQSGADNTPNPYAPMKRNRLNLGTDSVRDLKVLPPVSSSDARNPLPSTFLEVNAPTLSQQLEPEECSDNGLKKANGEK